MQDANQSDAFHSPAAIAGQPHPHHNGLPPAEHPLHGGRVLLDSDTLRRLRLEHLMSQQDLADDCWRRNIRVSIATIKRAESGRAVRFRVARELARCFGVLPAQLMRA